MYFFVVSYINFINILDYYFYLLLYTISVSIMIHSLYSNKISLLRHQQFHISIVSIYENSCLMKLNMLYKKNKINETTYLY